MPETVLIIAPHADDAELGAGGYLARLMREGATHAVVALVCASDVRYLHSGEVVGQGVRLREQREAALRLGAEMVFLGAGPENELHLASRGDLVTALDGLIAAYTPDLLCIPLPSFNQDHKAVFEACTASLRPSFNRHQPTTVLAYESPTQGWGTDNLPGVVAARHYVRLTGEDLAAKTHALAAHRSQMAGREHLLCGRDGVMALARLRGLECGAEFAEMFYVLRQVV